jgi:P4 family phage/plasmid primase-like protien
LDEKQQVLAREDPVELISWLRAEKLSPELRDVSTFWQYSSSMGTKGWSQLKLHLWFYLDEAFTSPQLKRWGKRVNSDQNLAEVDLSLFRPTQIHYTAAPLFEGKDPIKLRSGRLNGVKDAARLEIPVEQRQSTGLEKTHHRSIAEPQIKYPTKTVALEATTILREAWLREGDGYHNALMALAGALGRLRWEGDRIRWVLENAAPARVEPRAEEIVEIVNRTLKMLGKGGKGGEAVTGRPQFAKMLGKDVVDKAFELLDPNRREEVTYGTLLNTDLYNAEQLIADCGRDFIYCCGLNWVEWNGSCWVGDKKFGIEARSYDTVRRLAIEAREGLKVAKAVKASLEDSEAVDGAVDEAVASVKRAKKALKWAAASQNDSKIEAMIKRARSLPGVICIPDDFDTDPYLLNAKNGTIDLRTGDFREHRREDRITKLAPVDYDPAATAPLWDTFLKRIFDNDAELIGFVQRFLGYASTGRVSEEKFAVFYGTGANGKSTLLNAVRYVLGDYYSQADPDILLESKGPSSAKADSEKAALKGARLAVCSETSRARTINEGLLKQLASTDRIVGRRLYNEPIKFTPTHKLILVTNHKPRIRTTDEGTWRRLALIPFNVEIPVEERDGEFVEKLKAEAPGILRWLVTGCLEWQRQGLGSCKATSAATQEYREDEDVVGSWLDECVTIEPTAKCTISALYDSYKNWCERGSVYPTAKRTLGADLNQRGFKSVKSGSLRSRVGLKLKEAVAPKLKDHLSKISTDKILDPDTDE